MIKIYRIASLANQFVLIVSQSASRMISAVPFSNQLIFRPIRRRSLPGIRRLRAVIFLFALGFGFLFQPDCMDSTLGNQKLRQLVHCFPVGSLCTAGCAALKHNRQFFKGGGGSSMSRHAHRSYKSPAAFQARFAPGNSVSQMPAAPFLLVCRSRGCRYSSMYHQGQHLHLFPRHPRPLHRMAADCGCHGLLSGILRRARSQLYFFANSLTASLVLWYSHAIDRTIL